MLFPTIGITGLDRPLRLRPGEHGLVVAGDDFKTVTRSFTVKRGSDEQLHVTLVSKAEQVVQKPPPPSEPAAAPLPAVYRVQITPPEALLTARGFAGGAGVDEIAQEVIEEKGA